MSTALKAAAAARIRAATRRSWRSARRSPKRAIRAAFEPLEKAAALVPVGDRRGEPARGDGAARREAGRTAARDHGVSRAARARSHRGRGGAPAGRARREGRRRARSLQLGLRAHRRARSVRRRRAHRTRAAGAEAASDAGDRDARVQGGAGDGPADKASAHCDLGESYLLGGNRPPTRRREALAALEIAPSFERAQELLLKVDRGSDGTCRDDAR